MSRYDSVYSVLQKPVAEHQRNVFPLENAHSYSMKAGQITPIKAFHFKPNDYLKMKVSDFSITFPMNTAPFLRGRKEFAFYSVYYNAVWSLFNQFMATRTDNKTSVFGNYPDIDYEPCIPLIQLYSAVINQWVGYVFYNHIIKLAIGSVDDTLLISERSSWLAADYNGVFTVSDDYPELVSALQNTSNFASSVWQSLNHDFYDYQTYPTKKNKDWYFDIVGHWRWASWCRKLDMLGYGNIYPLLKSAENKIISLVDSTDFADPLSIQGSLVDVTTRICALIVTIYNSCVKYTGSTTNLSTVTNPVERKLNLYPICAYNSIFYHFFRNSYYDLNYFVRDYNLDFVQNLQVNNECQLEYFSLRFLDLEYHQWKKDKFTAVLPDQQFGSVSQLSLNVNIPQNSIISKGLQNGDVDKLSIVSNQYVLAHQGGTSKNLLAPSVSGSGNFDVIALKRAEMLQDYRQTLMRAGNKTTDVFRALYGTTPSSEHVEDIIPRFLETFGEDIFIDPVTATADTGQPNNGQLGDLSARGKFSGQSGNITFNAGGNFGLILCLAYVVPTAEYNSYMIDQHLGELTPEQHYLPQFENLGLEDLYSDELNCLRPLNSLGSLGKVPRYHQKKSEVDVVHGAFCSMRVADIINTSNIQGQFLDDFYGDFNHWVSPRTDMQDRQITLLRDLYINPSVLDNVFVQKAGSDLSKDQFICRTFFDLTSTKEMSKVGLVNFV